MRQVRYFLEAMGVWSIYHFFNSLPMDIASSLGGWLGRTVGPLLPVNAIGDANIAASLPHLTSSERKAILLEMWDNLGRTVAEFPHMYRLNKKNYAKRITVEGGEYLQMVTQREKEGKPSLLFSGHFANWEVYLKALYESGCLVASLYRKANNPFVDRLIQEVRRPYQRTAIPKGDSGMKEWVKSVRKAIPVALMMDQKANQGMDIPFFGRPAKTAPALAILALRYDCAIFPVNMVRLGRSAHFKIIVSPPMVITKRGNEQQDTVLLLTQINAFLEACVRANPGQWFWIHNRWKKKPGN